MNRTLPIIFLTLLALICSFSSTTIAANSDANEQAQQSVKSSSQLPPKKESSEANKKSDKELTESQKLSQKIDTINAEIIALVKTLEDAKGEDSGAIQLQLFYKNIELRRDIDNAIDNKNVETQLAKGLVDGQIGYAKNASDFLNNRLEALTEELSTQTPEQKLVILNYFRELNSYLDLIYKWRIENLNWLSKLGQPIESEQKVLQADVTQRLRLLSASINYYNRQQAIIDEQISVSPDSEKAKLQVAELIIAQRLGIAISSTQAIIDIADDLQIETSEYQQLVFETTGEFTYELLNLEVLFSLLKSLLNSTVDWLVNNGMAYLFKLLMFVLILFVARKLSKLAAIVVRRATDSTQLKVSTLMKDFIVSMSGKIVMLIGILFGLSQLGLDMTPVLAGFGIASIIIGFALQDTLSNLASGMMLLIYKPFDVGDFVFAGGVDGKVSHMSLVNTTIRTFDNQVIMIPNSKIWGDVIKNVTHERIRRVDMVFGIGYDDDILHAEKILNDIVTNHPDTLRMPEALIKLHVLNTSSVDFIVRPWVKTDNYWDVYWDITKAVKLRFDEEGITIPYPQQDVYIHKLGADKPNSEPT
ncbi:mechanosensitive ion channel family protein [Thalassotalea sp. Y01]|uniref:mechanosensitive ion channel family protein n=1 Tax=Thalassotalea sp. Y01 TaxID=2729613 RepID=UPI00145D25A5|nr:mechanosensitive ion channel family protein [Thalassotalea sp. Y01]NMP17591.1 mechanosensitive ion channel [Thalassotalea sp. Y01]